ncbi:MAG: EAL domain-containing protein [Gammaproteobacteria bacterium]|nr:EAL domain-containing protein [Gammaproteobacteria bacterium]
MPVASSTNIALPRRDVDQQVEGELTNLLFRNTRGLHVTTMIGALLIAILFGNEVPGAVLVLWTLFMLGTELVRAIIARRFNRTEIPLEEAPEWRRRFATGNLLAAIGWGSAGVLLFVPGNETAQVILVIIILSAVAVSIPALAADRKLFVTFSLLAVTPLLVRLLLQESPSSLVAAAMLIFLFPLLTAFALRISRQTIDELNMHFAYADLARELSGEVAVRRQAEGRLMDLANFDQLTGLPNRTLLRDRLDQALRKARRRDGRVAVLFLDLDRFKHINDSMGHHAGDDVLRTVSKRLQDCVRAENTVARLSGDEFIIIIEDFDSLDAVRAVTRRILMEVSEPIPLTDGNEVKLGASIGIALFPDHGKTVEALLQNADIAMYRAKTNGRNTFQVFAPDMHAEALTRMSRENALRRALENEEFYLAYQPQLDTFSNGYVGVEALLRWESPEYGSISPAEFIPLAEECGLITPIGDWVFRNACEQAVRFQEDFGSGFHMAVNLSAHQLDPDRLIGKVERMLEDTGADPRTIVIEITESIAMSNAHSNLTLLRKLRSMGFQLALDDFGTGNSSLTYLKRFPINTVKLDKSFIDKVTMNREDAAICKATIDLTNALELQVIAEGVESRDQADWLQKQNCFLMQGYLFSPPLRAHECSARISLTNNMRATAEGDMG